MSLDKILPFFTLTILIASVIKFSEGGREKISPEVIRSIIRTGSAPEVMVDLVTPANSFLSDLKSIKFPTRQARLSEAYTRLSNGVGRSQAGIIDILERERASNPAVTYTAFKTANKIYIRQAGKGLLDDIAAHNQVQSIREPVTMRVPEPIEFEEETPASRRISPTNEWGIEMVNAPQAWADGYTGKGITVGIIDTGCLADHEALRGNMKPDYGWHDPSGNHGRPYDSNGHGTHVTGTIVGFNGIGVAPGAEYISCLGCPDGSCPENALTSSFDYLLCPNPDGNCTAAPDIISCSWGGGQGSTYFYQEIRSCRDAGILSIFANGNYGPECETAISPGDSADVIAVGAVNKDTSACDFSSRGPSVFLTMKPDVSAPGRSIRSSWISGNNAYAYLSGTSMATPHVSGLLALLLQQHPNARGNPDALTALLTTRYVTTDVLTTDFCGGNASCPNNYHGYGLVRYSSY